MSRREQDILSETHLRSDLLKFFSPDQHILIFDIGSCEGEDSIKYGRLFPASKIYSFEPLPANQKILLDNLAKYHANNVTLVASALSDQAGIQDLHVSSGRPEGVPVGEDWDYGNKSSSLLPPDKNIGTLFPWLKFDKIIPVETNTLEKFFNDEHLHEIDFIHMDVQGAELKVLNGAGSYLRKIKVIWLEVSDVSLYKDQPYRKDVEYFMRSNGFCLYRNVTDGDYGDQMYFNSKYFKFKSWVLKIKRIFS
jgi:2-O-methyltransferase